MGKLSGKVAVVTGASRGIGKATALALAREGANIAFCARTERSAAGQWSGTIAETADAISALGVKAAPFKCDLSVREEVVEFHHAVIREFGRLDVLVNNALHTHPQMMFARFLDIDDEYWEKTFAVNVLAAVYGCKVAVPQMIKQGAGIIMFVTSSAATYEMPFLPDPAKTSVGAAYPSSKAAQLRLIGSLAKEMKPHNVSVVGLDPGPTSTEKYLNSVSTVARHPMEVPASAAAYLCTCPDPMKYTGLNLSAADLVKEQQLL